MKAYRFLKSLKTNNNTSPVVTTTELLVKESLMLIQDKDCQILSYGQ